MIRRALRPVSSIRRRFVRHFSDLSDLGERECMEYDVVIVGAGPAGLATAIKLKQLAAEKDNEINVCVIEKGAEVGAHILSGNVFNPVALNELFPNWEELGAPLKTKAGDEHVYFMTEHKSIPLPVPPPMHNEGNYIISLGELCRWMGEQAEELGVEIYPGFAASELLYDDKGDVKGIATGDMGLNKDGTPGDNFARGMEILAAQTVLGEGCRGSLSEQIMKLFKLRDNCVPQSYGLGLKEVWDINPEKCKPGTIIHSLGWPLDFSTYGGGFLYMTSENQAYVGLVVGLDYENPYLSPYEEFQRYKTHPKIKEILEGGDCRSYGARCINEGGFQAIPKLTFPGGLMVGCSAGFVNVPAIKGSHYAMKTGMLAAESIFQNHLYPARNELTSYEDKVKESWVYSDLKAVRNVKPSHKYGFLPMMAHSGFSTFISKGSEPWTIKNEHTDSACTKPAKNFTPIQYPKPDGKLTFDILTSVSRTDTYHEPDEPCHLKIKEDLAYVPEKVSMQEYAAPETRFCPARVYEYHEDTATGKPKLVINNQNCIHCKCCSIKMPSEYINWTVPQGGGGPKYATM